MKAWRFHGTHKPLTLDENLEIPTAGEGEVVVKVMAAGICHSDVSALEDEGWMPLWNELPHTLGHENAGVITEVGPGMEQWKVGDRVGLSPVMPDGDALGYGKWDGGFGEYLKATDHNLVKLPDEISFEMGAMATDAGLTSYHAVVARGGADKGKKVGIIGLGGLGYIGARVAVLRGAEVYGVDISPEARALADEIGLAGVAENISDFKDIGLDVIVDYAGFNTIQPALEVLNEHGTFVQVGMGKLDADLNTYPIIIKQLNILGSKSGTKEDLEALYEMMRSGDLNPPMNIISHDEVPASLERLSQGGIVGRLVIRYED